MDNCEVSKRQVLLSFVYEDRPYRVIASLGNVSADDVVIFIEQHVMDTKENKENKDIWIKVSSELGDKNCMTIEQCTNMLEQISNFVNKNFIMV